MFNAIIIEDESHSSATLKNLIHKYCPSVAVRDEADCIDGAIRLIETHHPDVVFLDIHLRHENGFELFDRLPQPDFEVIFTTAFDHYAAKAFRMAALDYLLKPVNIDELQTAVKRLEGPRSFQIQKLNTARQLCDTQQLDKLMLPTSQGFEFVPIDTILYLKADKNYTEFHFMDRKPILVCRTLLEYEQMLKDFLFYRIHHKYLINLQKVDGFNSQENYVTMTNGEKLLTSLRKKSEFLKQFIGRSQ
jgi:two-component system, LytTR family, response regulator